MKTGKLPVFDHMQAAFYVTISAHWLIDWLVGLLIGLHNIFKTEGKLPSSAKISFQPRFIKETSFMQ